MKQNEYRSWAVSHLLNVIASFQTKQHWFTTHELAKQIRDQVNVKGQSPAPIAQVRDSAIMMANRYYKQNVTNDSVRNRPGYWEFYAFNERITRGLNLLVKLGWMQRRIYKQYKKAAWPRDTVVTIYQYSLN